MTLRFKDVQKSDNVEDYVRNEIKLILEKFPKLKNHKIEILVAKNTAQRGKILDGYFTHLSIEGFYYKKIFIKKYAKTIFEALSEVLSLISNQLNKTGDRQRVISIKSNRDYVRRGSAGLNQNGAEFELEKVS